jgi:hypothetical protein
MGWRSGNRSEWSGSSRCGFRCASRASTGRRALRSPRPSRHADRHAVRASAGLCGVARRLTRLAGGAREGGCSSAARQAHAVADRQAAGSGLSAPAVVPPPAPVGGRRSRLRVRMRHLCDDAGARRALPARSVSDRRRRARARASGASGMVVECELADRLSPYAVPVEVLPAPRAEGLRILSASRC